MGYLVLLQVFQIYTLVDDLLINQVTAHFFIL